MPSFHLLVILLFLIVVLFSTSTTTAFILQDLPLERFERSGHHHHQHHGSSSAEQLFVPQQLNERHTRANQLYRPGANFWARYRMMSG